MRFAKMLMLSGLTVLLKNYTFEMDETTPDKVTFDPRCIVNHPSCNINIKLISRKK